MYVFMQKRFKAINFQLLVAYLPTTRKKIPFTPNFTLRFIWKSYIIWPISFSFCWDFNSAVDLLAKDYE